MLVILFRENLNFLAYYFSKSQKNIKGIEGFKTPLPFCGPQMYVGQGRSTSCARPPLS